MGTINFALGLAVMIGLVAAGLNLRRWYWVALAALGCALLIALIEAAYWGAFSARMMPRAFARLVLYLAIGFAAYAARGGFRRR